MNSRVQISLSHEEYSSLKRLLEIKTSDIASTLKGESSDERKLVFMLRGTLGMANVLSECSDYEPNNEIL